MENNKNNFKSGSGNKQFSRDGGRDSRSGNFNRNDRSYGSNKSGNSGGQNRFSKFGDKPRYSSNNSSNSSGFSKNNDRDNRDNRFNNNRGGQGGDFKRNDRGYSSNRPNNFNKFGDKPHDNNRDGGYNRDNRDNKGGGFNRDNRGGQGGDFKRNDRGYSSNRPNNFNKFGDKPRENREGGYNRDNRSGGFNRDNRSGDFKRNDRGYGSSNQSGNSGRPNNFNKFGDKPRYNSNNSFNRNDRNDRFNKPFERKFDKPFDKPAVITETVSDNTGIIASVEQEDSGMVYGRNAVIELLKSDRSIDKLFIQSGQREGSITLIFAEAVKKAIPIIEAEKSRLDSMINNSAHQGVIALASEKEYCSVDDILQIAEDRGEKPFILIADKIMDPHNLGAIIRTAECAGVHGIIIPKRHAAGISPIVTKTSAGASVHMAVAKVANIANTAEELKEKGVWIFSSALDLSENGDAKAKDYADADYNLPLALIVGNEGEGLSPIVIQKSDFLVKIPMLGKIESLNVSCAAAVLMYEISRQRKQK